MLVIDESVKVKRFMSIEPGKVDKIKRYLMEVKNLANESAKRHQFGTLIGELFPNSLVADYFARGIEKIVRIDLASGGVKAGRIDSYYGNYIIEFENSLKATERKAIEQLKEYTVGIWKEEKGKRRPLVCIASDGIRWKSYVPQIKEGVGEKITSGEIELELLREIELTEQSIGDFYNWIVGLLFREGQLNPTAEMFQMDFGGKSATFRYALQGLRKAWATVGDGAEPELAFETWKQYLSVTYGSLGNGEEGKEESVAEMTTLFLKHTYLATVASLLIWASLAKGKVTRELDEEIAEIISGKFFQAHKIENIVENDFFQWVRLECAEKVLMPEWERILTQLLQYDLSRLNQDVLKGVYQELVDPKDRHDLGEYYTPEWLCEKVVAEVLPKEVVKVLDPSCGSGSFLRATITHFIEHNKATDAEKMLTDILGNVYGIDIHPLAVIIAKATYVLAIRNLLSGAKRPIQVPVYLADALFLPSEVVQKNLWATGGYEIRFGDK
jgi:N-6 DNA Methylase